MSEQQKRKQVFFVYMIYFIAMMLFCTVRIIASSNIIKIDNYYWYELLFSFLIQIMIMVIIPTILFRVLLGKKTLKESVPFGKLSAKAVITTIIIGCILFLLNIGVSSFFQGAIYWFGYQTPMGVTSTPVQTDTSIWSFLFEMLITAVLPAFCEEYLHRGLLLYGSKHIGYRKAIVMSAILFGMMHFSIQKVFYAAILGLLIGLMVVMTKSIWVGIILHFMNNGINVYLNYASANKWFGHNFYDILNNILTSSNIFLSLIAIFSFLAVLCLLLAFLMAKLFQQTTYKKVNNAVSSVILENNENEEWQKTIQIVTKELIQNNSTYNDQFSMKENPIDMILPKEKDKISNTLGMNLFLIGSIVLGVLVNISTFIWGLI